MNPPLPQALPGGGQPPVWYGAAGATRESGVSRRLVLACAAAPGAARAQSARRAFLRPCPLQSQDAFGFLYPLAMSAGDR